MKGNKNVTIKLHSPRVYPNGLSCFSEACQTWQTQNLDLRPNVRTPHTVTAVAIAAAVSHHHITSSLSMLSLTLLNYINLRHKLEALRENKPPPNTAWHKSVCNFLSNPEDPDFGLWTPGSKAWSGSPPKLYQLVLEPCPTPTKKFRQNPFTSLRVIQRTDRQTDKQTTPKT